MNEHHRNKTGVKSDWIPVILFIVLAIGLRLFRTSNPDHYLLAGADGPYFPLQVRSILEQGRLAFPDMPLLFYLTAGIAKLLGILHLSGGADAVLLAIRFTDAFLPPLAAIPVFLLAKEIAGENRRITLLAYIVIAFSVLSYTPLYIFSYQLQKNALAVPLIFFFLLFAYRFIRYEKRSDAIKAVSVLALCALTHFGSFSILLFMAVLLNIFWLVTKRNGDKARLLKVEALGLTVFLLLVLGISIADPERFQRLWRIPLRIFEGPVFLFALNGQNYLLRGNTLLYIIIFNALALAGMILVFRRSSYVRKADIILAAAMACCTIMMSSPLLGLEWANRMYIMAYAPVSILYLIIFQTVPGRWLQVPAAVIFCMLICYALATSIFAPPVYSLSKESYAAFRQIGESIHFTPGDAIVARQDLRLLSSWEFRTKGYPAYLMTKKNFHSHDRVFLLTQSNGKFKWLRDAEPLVPDKVIHTYQGDFFLVDKLMNDSSLKNIEEKPFRGVRGIIAAINGNEVLVRDPVTGANRKIILSGRTRIIFWGPRQELQMGMQVEVNGSWRPFSIDINAETIKVLYVG